MKLLLCLLMWYSIHVTGQNLSSGLKKYYSYTNKAEIAITDSAYVQAAMYYQCAFKLKTDPFGRDLFNAMVCNALAKNNSIAYLYGKRLLKNGYSIKALKSKTSLLAFFKSSDGIQLENESSSFSKSSQQKIFWMQFDSIAKTDQKFRIIEPNYHVGVYLDTIDKIDSSNVVFLKQFIKKYGFPGEKLIGLNDTDLARHPYSIILLHQAYGARRGQMHNFYKTLEAAMHEGILDSRYATYMMDVCNGTDNFGNQAARFYYYAYDSIGTPDSPLAKWLAKNRANLQWTYEPLDQAKQAEYDVLRQNNGLEPINEYRKKLRYWLKDQDTTFQFDILGGCSINTVIDREFYEKINKFMIPIDKL